MSDKNKFWFKRRRYGWGFVPVTWQGWLLVLDFLVIVIGGSVLFEKSIGKSASDKEIFVYYAGLFALVCILIYISLARGPKPHWRWGKKPTDNPDEDW